MKQKLAVLFVTAALALFALPMAAFAEGTTHVTDEDTLRTAIIDTACTTIVLDKDIALAAPISFDRSVTLQSNDGDTYTLSAGEDFSVDENLVTFTAGGTVNNVRLDAAGKAKYAVHAYNCKVVINGCQLDNGSYRGLLVNGAGASATVSKTSFTGNRYSAIEVGSSSAGTPAYRCVTLNGDVNSSNDLLQVDIEGKDPYAGRYVTDTGNVYDFPVKTESQLRDALAFGETSIILGDNINLSSMLTINVPDVTLDLGNNIISAADDFAFTDTNNNSRHLVDITANDVVLRNGTLLAGANNNHTLNVWNAQNVQLANLKLDNSAAGVGGAPLIVGASDVTVTGPLETVTGRNSWYAINVDSRNVNGAAVGASFTVNEASPINFSGLNPLGIFMENTAQTGVDVAFQPNARISSDIAGFVPVQVKKDSGATVTNPENAGLYANEDGSFTTTPPAAPVLTTGTVKYGSTEYEAVFANGNPARVYEENGKTCVDVTGPDGKVETYTFATDLRVVFGGSNAVEGGVAKLPETNIVMDGGKVNYLFGASHTDKDHPISVNGVKITVNGGTVNVVQTTEQGGGMGSFDNCDKYHVGTSDIVIENGKIGAVVGGAYGYTQVDHVYVTVNGGEIKPADLVSPVQTGIMLAGTNGKVDTATLHVNGGTVNGVAAAQRCYVSSGVTYNFVGGTVGDVYLGSYYPVATEGSSAWKTWGSPTAVGNINYGQVAGQFTVNIGETATLNGLYPGYQYLTAEREAILDAGLVKGSIPAGADNADTAKTPVTIRMSPTAKAVDSYLLGNTAVTLPGNHFYEITASTGSGIIDTMTSEVVLAVTEVTTSVDIPSAVESVFDDLLDGDQKTGCELTDAAEKYIASHAGDIELKVQVLVNNLSDSDVPAAEKALITSKGAIAQYIDISLALSDDGNLVPDAEITKTGQPLHFNVEIPDFLVKEGRTFKIVSVHEGQLIEHPTTVTTENGVTVASFSSDSFSTYGLIFTDASSGNGNNGGSGSSNTATPAPAQVLDSTPKTGAVSLAALPLAALAFAGVGLVLRKRED